MELNREQIVKALECCRYSTNYNSDSCVKCPYFHLFDLEDSCYIELYGKTVALIRELTEENERLKASCTELAQCLTKLETLYKVECKRVDTVKADTVRKMQERLDASEFFLHADQDDCLRYVDFREWIDQIVKEMLEEDGDG